MLALFKLLVVTFLLDLSRSQTPSIEEECFQQIDLIFLLDASSSVADSNGWVPMKEWVKDMTEELHIDHDHIQVGVVQYSEYEENVRWDKQEFIKTEIQLGRFHNITEFDRKMDEMMDVQGGTDTAHALKIVILRDFESAYHRYPNAQRVVILVTDGVTDDEQLIPEVVELAREREVTVYAIGVGAAVESQLRLFTGNDSDRVYKKATHSNLDEIRSELLVKVQGQCHCDLDGSIGSSCDECTRQCQCKRNVEGRRCNRCVEFHYGFGNEEGCQRCTCSLIGTDLSTCDGSECNCSSTGMCKCLPHVIGRNCDRCELGYYQIQVDRGCIACDCNIAGSIGIHCYQETGQCECKKQFSGKTCSECNLNYYRTPGSENCLPCPCNPNGVVPGTTCDSNGACTCKEGFVGDDCDECGFGYDPILGGCRRCYCNPNGVMPGTTCDSNGVCTCKEGFTGDDCGGCDDGYYSIPGGCSRCFCNPNGVMPGATCDSNGVCTCKEGFVGGDCGDCDDGYYSIPGGCSRCFCNPNGVMPGATCDSNGVCICKEGFVGGDCGDCDDGYYSIPGGCSQCRCNRNGVMPGTTCNSNGVCICKEGFVGDDCGECGFGYDSIPGGCRRCFCNPNGVMPGTACDSNGVCTCKEGFLGPKCAGCDDGYYTILGGCRRCRCNQTGVIRGTTCDSNGVCTCKEGFAGDDCGDCDDGYYSIPGGCSRCRCNRNGVMGGTTCNSNGVCTCKEGFAGDDCGDCDDGYYSIPGGCSRCRCNPNGVMRGTTCNSNGVCTCKEGFAGDDCGDCDDGYYSIPGGCSRCRCNPNGVMRGTTCNSNGVCTCKEGFAGDDCGDCDDGYYSIPGGCLRCRCNRNGVMPGTTCNSNGVCICKEGFVGDDCDECGFGYDSIPGGCRRCFCNPNGVMPGTACDSNGVCSCKEGFLGPKCVGCDDGYYSIPGGCRKLNCSCNPNGVMPGSTCDSSGVCTCKEGFLGPKCVDCDVGYASIPGGCQKCVCNPNGVLPGTTCDPVNSLCQCKEGFAGPHCSICDDGYTPNPGGCELCSCNRNGIKRHTSCDQITGACDCKKGYTGLKCFGCDDGYYSDSGRCRKCKCSQNGVEPGTFCDKTTGRCNCKRVYRGKKCKICEQGYFYIPGGCKKCYCNRAGAVNWRDCNQETGECQCKEGFTGPTCHLCESGYFPIPGGCQNCFCNPVGVVPGTVCSQMTRRCVCKEGFTGRKCDRCESGYRSSKEGCERCQCDSVGTIRRRTCNENGKCPCKEGFAGPTCSDCDIGYVPIVGRRKQCRECFQKIDIVFVLDSSGSIKTDGFNQIKMWVKTLADDLHFEHGHIQIGVVKYSEYNASLPLDEQRYIRTEVELGEFSNLQKFKEKIDKIHYDRGTTNTAHALDKTLGYDLNPKKSRSRFPEAKRVIILLTDGISSDSQDLPAVIAKSNEMGVVIYAVGVGDYDLTELKEITGDDARISEVQLFSELPNIAHNVLREVAKACDCNLAGSINNECDPCTRECRCKTNVVGRRCDRCADGYYGIRNTRICNNRCRCNRDGIVYNTTCDQITGQCKCKTGYIGRTCTECANGYSLVGGSCQACQSPIDLMVVVDGSTSVTETNFVKIKTWLKRFADAMAINLGSIYMGVVVYSHYVRGNDLDEQPYVQTVVPLGEHRNLTQLDETIDKNMTYNSGNTWTAYTLENVMKLNFVGGNNRYPDAKRTILLITDGNSSDREHLPTALQLAKNKSISIFVIAINASNEIDIDEINQISDYNENRIFIENDFDNLTDVVDGIKTQLYADCDCEPAGSIEPISCDRCSGKCDCKPNVLGRSCTRCAEFHYGYGRKDGCVECGCYRRGTYRRTCVGERCTCSNLGQCDCLPNVVGKKCNRCKDNYYFMRPEKGCKSCHCHIPGTVNNSICDQVTGVCPCKNGYMGRRCSHCKDGYMLISGRCIRKPTPTPIISTTPASTSCWPPNWNPCRDCFGWPSYCRSWICKRRWPHSPQIPSSRRCHPYDWFCRMAVEYFRNFYFQAYFPNPMNPNRPFPPITGSDTEEQPALGIISNRG